MNYSVSKVKEQLVGLDLGRSNVKMYDGYHLIDFPSVIGEARPLVLKTNYGKKGFHASYDGQDFFVGDLAINESEFCRQMLTDEKSTEDAKRLALVALSHLDADIFDVVTGVPVHMHTKENKEKMVQLLQGTHTITVNGVKKTFTIRRVLVAVEGGGAFWSNPKDGKVRIIDGGSKTINYITLNNRKYVDRDSGTLLFGFDTNKSTDLKEMVNRIAGEVSRKWEKDDLVFTVGGRAKDLAKELKTYFPNAQELQADNALLLREGNLHDRNLFANAIGFYEAGRVV